MKVHVCVCVRVRVRALQYWYSMHLTSITVGIGWKLLYGTKTTLIISHNVDFMYTAACSTAFVYPVAHYSNDCERVLGLNID